MTGKTKWKGKIIEYIEHNIAARLEQFPEIDTFTNLLSFGLHGGELRGEECREWIFIEGPKGAGLAAIRTYGEGQKSLNSIGEIEFSEDGREIVGYKTGKIGTDPTKAYPDRLAEELGLLRGITGGIIPSQRGDIIDEGIKDLRPARDVAAKVAIDHYVERGKTPGKRKFIGQKNGMKFYTVEIPMSDSSWGLFDTKGYDIELIKDYVKLGTCYSLLSPLYKPLRNALKKRNFNVDALFETHMDQAYSIARSGVGDVTLAAYPALIAVHGARKYLLDGWNFNGKGTQTTQ